jgi:hypothetical protein
MIDVESNIQAYRTMAEVLISFRKIMLRGLRKVSGETWYLDACPPGVYERLVERKETELAIERLSVEYEDLMSFATFGDLAEIVEFNDDLARLLRTLAPSKEVLCARLSELESLRSKLSMARALSEEEISILTNYSNDLQEILAGARKKAKKSGPVVEEEIAPPAPVAVEDEPGLGPEPLGKPVPVLPVKPPSDHPPPTEEVATVEPVAEPVEPVAPPEAEVVEAAPEPAAVEAETTLAPSETDVGAEAPDEEAETEPSTEDVEVESAAEEAQVAVADTAEVEAEEVGDERVLEELVDEEEPIPSVPLITVDPAKLAADMEQVLEEGDDREALRLLRREIIAVAEAVYRLDEEIVTKGWQVVQDAGWFDERKSDLGLEPLEEFHGVVEDFRSSQSQGASEEELRSFLADRDFSKLLLALREVFLRNKM